jgi:hypothetical protein
MRTDTFQTYTTYADGNPDPGLGWAKTWIC